jgi:cobaltochelatase CobS
MTTLTNSPIILATNSLSLKERAEQQKNAGIKADVDLKNNEISVIAFSDDIKNGIEKFYPYRWGMYYDMENGFKPNIPAGQKIKGELVTEFINLLPEAKEKFNELKNLLTSSNSISTETYEKKIVELRQQLDNKDALIEHLQENAKTNQTTSSNNNQIERLEKLIQEQTNNLQLAQNFKPKTIFIKINDTEKEIKAEAIHPKFASIIKAVRKNKPVYLWGPAGTGKSDISEKVADALGYKFYPASTITQEFKLTGFEDANGNYHDTQFYKAFVNGGLFMLDEMDASAPETLIVINTAISQRYFDFPHGRENAHPDFRIIAGGNTIGMGVENGYTGRFQIDKSTMDRYLKIFIDYDMEIEKVITGNNIELIDFAHAFRESVKNLSYDILFSYRSLDRIADLESDFELEELLEMSLVSGIASDDLNMIIRNMNLISSNKYFKALKKLA